jgi:hypothetical protein
MLLSSRGFRQPQLSPHNFHNLLVRVLHCAASINDDNSLSFSRRQCQVRIADASEECPILLLEATLVVFITAASSIAPPSPVHAVSDVGIHQDCQLRL